MEDYRQDSVMRYLIGASRVKYVVLDSLFRGMCIPGGVVFHIDAHSIFYRLFRNKNLSDIMAIDDDIIVKDIVVNFINVLAHYRMYAATKLHATNDIIVYFNTKCPIYQKSLFPDYRHKEYDKYDSENKDYGKLWELTKLAFSFIANMCQYFNGIYVIENDNIDDYSAMYHFINVDKYNEAMHIIFSRNILTTQLINSKVIQLYPKRDNSYLITMDTVFTNGVLKDRKFKQSEKLTPSMLPLAWTLAGCQDICMPSSDYVRGIVDVLKVCNKLADDNMISENMSIQEFLKTYSTQVINGKIILRSVPKELVDRYRVLNIPLAYKALSTDQIQKLAKNYYDLFDQNMLEQMNELLSNINSNSDLLEITALNMDTGIIYEY